MLPAAPGFPLPTCATPRASTGGERRARLAGSAAASRSPRLRRVATRTPGRHSPTPPRSSRRRGLDPAPPPHLFQARGRRGSEAEDQVLGGDLVEADLVGEQGKGQRAGKAAGALCPGRQVERV